MSVLLKKSILLIFTILLFAQNNHSQIQNDDRGFLHQMFIATIESGVSYGFTDYKTSHFEPLIRGSIEFNPVTFGRARMGLKLFGGGLKISESDNRGLFSNNDLPNPRQMPADIYTDIIQLGGSFNFGFLISDNIIPYLGVGVTYLNFSPKNSDGKRLDFNAQNRYDKQIFSLLIEGGVKYQISDRFSINLGLSYCPTNSDYLDDISASKKNDSFISGLIGLSYSFSGRKDSDEDGVPDYRDICPDTPLGVAVDENGCPFDSDKDGVPDYLDKCPDTPIGAAVDESGCPKDSDKDGVPDYLDKCPDTPNGVVVDESGCPIDSDKDGVPDYLDKCPNTPAGIVVDKDGCPLDSDKDGVPDYLDKCPDTPPNTKVDANGCPETALQQEETFYQFILRGDDTFEPNTATLIESSKILLNEIATYIKTQSGSKWKIEGYMDNQGSASFLKKLSYDRAKAVYDYFISQGLSAEQFTISGLGNASPIASNNTTEGRSTNRRILIIRGD